MNESNSIETIDKTKLAEQTKIRLYEITKLKIIFTKRLIRERHAVKH